MSVIPVEVSEFINNTIENTVNDIIDIEKATKNIIAAGVNQARAARSAQLKQVRYASVNKGFTRLSPVLANGFIEVNKSYLDAITATASKAIEFAESAQTQHAQIVGQVIPSLLKTDVEREVNAIEIASKIVVNGIEIETERGLADIEIENAHEIADVKTDYRRKVAKSDAAGEIAARKIEVTKQIGTMEATNAIKVQNELDVGLIKYSGQVQIQADILAAELEGKSKTSQARINASTAMSGARNTAAMNESQARYDGAVAVGDARLYAAQTVGNAEISKEETISNAKIDAFGNEQAAKLDAFDITSTAKKQSETNSVIARLKAAKLTAGARLNQFSATSGARLKATKNQSAARGDATKLVNGTKLTASSLLSAVKQTAMTTEFDGLKDAKDLTRAAELKNIQAEIDLTTKLRGASNKKQTGYKAQESSLRISATSAEYEKLRETNNSENQKEIELIGAVNSKKQLAIQEKISADSYAIGREQAALQYKNTKEFTSKSGIEGQRMGLEIGIANAEATSKLQLMQADLLARIAHANKISGARISAANQKKGAQISAANSKKQTQIKAAQEKRTAYDTAADTENAAYTLVLQNENASKSGIAKAESQARINAHTKEEAAFIQFLKDSASNKAENEQKIENAKIKADGKIIDAQDYALDSTLKTNDYVQKKQDETRYKIALSDLAFKYQSDAQAVYADVYTKLVIAESQLQSAKSSRLQTRHFFNDGANG